jgi:ribosome maturation factor RimP
LNRARGGAGQSQKERELSTQELQATIETRLRDFDPEVELIALEQPAAESLRLYIDRPGGVDLALCEAVTGELRDLLERYSLEVSSPGIDRPLTKPEHFRRFLGRRIRVRTTEAIAGRRNFTGTLAEADDETVTVAAEGAPVRIPIAGIKRSNLIGEVSL